MTTFMKRLAGASMLLTFAASGVWASTADGIKALEAQDYKTAKQEFTDAAAKDDTEAMYYLGLMMQRGLGDRAQPLAATVWWERASYLRFGQWLYRLWPRYGMSRRFWESGGDEKRILLANAVLMGVICMKKKGL